MGGWLGGSESYLKMYQILLHRQASFALLMTAVQYVFSLCGNGSVPEVTEMVLF